MNSLILKFGISTLAGIALCIAALPTVAVAGELRTGSELAIASYLSPCAEKSLSAVTQPLDERTVEPPREIQLAHGTWHPCANDANACGAGHSCCEGHCVKGACGD